MSDSGPFLGQVVDNDDPAGRGRIRVLVPDLNTREPLPSWVRPMQSFGKPRRRGRRARGSMVVPDVDATVVIFLIGGNPELPLWMPGPTLDGETPDEMQPSQRERFADGIASTAALLQGRAVSVTERGNGDLDVASESALKASFREIEVNRGTASQLAARTGDAVELDLAFTGVFNPTTGALTSLTLTSGGRSTTLTALSPTGTLTASGRIVEGATNIRIGGPKARP